LRLKRYEESVAHWPQPGRDLPAWPEAVRRLRAEGRKVPLRHPAADGAEQRFAEPRMSCGMRL
jgi:hypothetical protein